MMPYSCGKRCAFVEHRGTAKIRGIEFNFSFEEWEQWWESNLGPNWLSLRGKRRGQYVMARNGDTGPYAPSNVKCITTEENLSSSDHSYLHKRRGEASPVAKLTLQQAREVRALYVPRSLTNGGNALARKLGVSRSVIQDCVNNKTYHDEVVSSHR